MAKITELPQGSGLSATDVFPYVDVPNNVTKKYPASGLLSALASADTSDIMGALMENTTPGSRHRMLFGGRNLGTGVTEAQKTAIQNGSFKGLLVGDYWAINDVKWRIVDMDYWFASGISDIIFEHHLVIMPDTNLTDANMNDTDTTKGGYIGSKLYKETLPTVQATCAAAFPGMILPHGEYLVSEVVDGKPSKVEAVNHSYVELPDEIMMYGSNIMDSLTAPDGMRNPPTMNKLQFALFTLNPYYITSERTFWLRNPASKTQFTYVNRIGSAHAYRAAGDKLGVRPVFAIAVSNRALGK